MNKIKISVIMAEYNTKPEVLVAAIDSIATQTFKDFELIIVDDKSDTDISQIIAKLNDSRVRLVKNKVNMGAAYSRDRAIKMSRGKYVAIMDADDISNEERLQKLYNFITNHPEYDVVGSLAEEFYDDCSCGLIGWPGVNSKKDLIRGKMPIHASSIINKEAYSKVRYDSHYRRAQDYVLFCQMAIAGSRMYTINEVLYRYRVTPDDYLKRGIKSRRYEIEARLKLYPMMGASLFEYLYIIKSIIAGIVPARFAKYYRDKFVVRNST
jgi:glycosyltransferase EpsE